MDTFDALFKHRFEFALVRFQPVHPPLKLCHLLIEETHTPIAAVREGSNVISRSEFIGI